MKILVLIFVALLVTGLTAWTAQTQGGEVIVHVADYTVRASLLMALLVGIGTMFGIFVLVGLLSRTLETPQRLRKRHKSRRRDRTDILFAQGLRNMLEDRLDAARQDLEQAAKMEPKQSIFQLLAASVCIKANDRDAWNAHLRAVTDPDYQTASTWLKADGLVAAGEWEEALAVLQVLAGDNPRNPRVLRQLARCYRELNSWERLFELGRDQVRLAHLPQDETRQWLRDAAYRLCEDTQESELKSLWPKLGDARDDPEVLRHYIGRLQRCGLSHPELEPHLRKLLDSNLDDTAIELYGMLPNPITPNMVEKVRKWLAKNPEQVSLKRTLARLHSRLGQHAEAREQLEALEKQGGDALLYRELGETLERMGQGEAAQAYYRKGLQSLDKTP
ncbi:MAG: hypothetical protein OXC38_06340 [Gammaproteobacteria bacterium]|nr:hypothetical protein [Gammaproteobacteria bacterium]